MVFPLAPEMSANHDGSTKNDCERKAMKRLITSFRENHPPLKTLVLADGLSSNAPTVNHVKIPDLRLILGPKPGDHKFLFNGGATSPQTATINRTTREKTKTITHHFTWMNKVPLHASTMDLEVTVLHFTEISPDGRERRWSWVSDLTLDSTNVRAVMRTGRTRGRIEKETFQTLKTTGDNFEHNYGHGDTDIANVLSSLCMLAFRLDPITEHGCGLVKSALHKQICKKYLWAAMVALFRTVCINR